MFGAKMRLMDKLRRAFVDRLNEVCDDKQLPAERGRQARLAETFKVTPQAARKWLMGEVYPNHEKLMEIAIWADVSFEWLVTGRGEKKLRYGTPDPNIQHAVEVMNAMEPTKRYLAARLIDTLSKDQ